MTATIAIQHYAFKEGRAAANNGYTGPVPNYVNSRDAGQWVDGYTSEIKARLALGLPALGGGVRGGMTFVYHANVATGYVPASEAPTVKLRFESIDHDPGELVGVTLCGVEIISFLPPLVKQRLEEYRALSAMFAKAREAE